VIFREAAIAGAFVIEQERSVDGRGFFARTWCEREFRKHGLKGSLVQCSTSFNTQKGTLRGLHYQAAPHEEAKLVRCTRGSVYDVVVDLRQGSPTFAGHFTVVLDGRHGNMVYVPEGCAHGFLTLEDDCEVFYQMSQFYAPHSARGVRWDDPAFAIEWPAPVSVMSDRDRNYPDFLPGT
jgi:dTDP-4-dehydrorhamnose 3,5-epimerase